MNHDTDSKDRRHQHLVTDANLERIAERAKDLALEQVYADIGKGIVKRFLWLLGLGGSALAVWLAAHGLIK